MLITGAITFNFAREGKYRQGNIVNYMISYSSKCYMFEIFFLYYVFEKILILKMWGLNFRWSFLYSIRHAVFENRLYFVTAEQLAISKKYKLARIGYIQWLITFLHKRWQQKSANEKRRIQLKQFYKWKKKIWSQLLNRNLSNSEIYEKISSKTAYQFLFITRQKKGKSRRLL